MKNNLYARFGIILGGILLVIAMAYAQSGFKLKGGIDLVGGTDLLYELNLSDYHGDTRTLAQQVIDVLKKRVDPKGVQNMVWRVVGGNRIEVQMPMADKPTRDARKAFQDAQGALRDTNLQPFQVTAAVDQAGTKRTAALDALAAAGTPERAALDALAAAADARKLAEKDVASYADPSKIPGIVLDHLTAARTAYDKALSDVKGYNVNVPEVSDLMAVADTKPQAAKALQTIIDNPLYATKKPLFAKMQTAYDKLKAQKGGGLDDPDELERLLRGSGVLDFRIAVERLDPLMQATITQAQSDLEAHGPSKTITGGAKVGWFEIDPENGTDLKDPRYVEGNWGGRSYILLYTDRARALTHEPGREWSAIEPSKGYTQEGRRTVNFKLDAKGQIYFGELTQANVQKYMAILLDNKAISAPTINDPIWGGQVQISLGTNADAAEKEADTLVQTFNAGSLPATLQSEPISKKTIDSSLGDDNIKAGFRSGIIAVIAVMAFMVIYYTITGFFANVALLINLILLMGCMSAIGATFTLPGIAGIVLTLGMAVDANVLINERIREELHKGASLWNAVKQGYDKVFWTIFDANTTTSLTSIVLIYVASEEVKGFGVTLLIGLVIHMFTALFVTRTLMIAAIRWGFFKAIDDLSLAEYLKDIFTGTWLRGRWPFMRVFHLTNFDWIGKRHIFWAVSAITIVAGLVAFGLRGSDKYDTEFNGGTDVTFALKPGHDLTTEQVRARVYAIPDDPKLSPDDRAKLRDLSQASVYQVRTDKADAVKQFEIVTTIADKSHQETDPSGKVITVVDKRKQLLLDQLLGAFSDVMNVVKPIEFQGEPLSGKDALTLMDQKLVFPITKPNVTPEELNAPGTESVDVSAYQGGVAMVLNLPQPTDIADIKRRIADMRHSDIEKVAVDRTADVLPVTPPVPGANGLVTKALVVVSDANISYDKDPIRWQNELVPSEWDLVKAAMDKTGGFQGVTSFDPQVATEAKVRAVVAVLLSLILIVIYVWIRFGGIRYGLGAIFSLVHDAIVAIAATVLSGVVVGLLINSAAGRSVVNGLLLSDFKINLTMIAAYLTVIGYSVNDTIVIFDRIRENRGRDASRPLSAKLVNDSINQCFGRTIWTTFTVFIVVLIMYIWGGEGVHGFSYAMLIGVFTGAYSTLAIASPMLLNAEVAAAQAETSIAVIPEVGAGRSGIIPGK